MEAPSSRHKSRNGQSDTPARGARKYRLGSVRFPSLTGIGSNDGPRVRVPPAAAAAGSPRAAKGASWLRAPTDMQAALVTAHPCRVQGATASLQVAQRPNG